MTKKILTILFFSLFLSLLFNIPKTIAHPLDITGSEVYVSSGNSQINVHTYIHPFLIGLLLDDKKAVYSSSNDFYNHKKIIVNYLNDNLLFKNNDTPCKMVSANLPELDEFEIMGGGFRTDLILNCYKEIEKLEFTNKLFIEYSNLQTNKMVFFKDNEIQFFTVDKKEYNEKILTAKITSDFFDFNNGNNNIIKLTDTDGDGLSDFEEKVYGTSINITDSDFDGYTDKEEIDNGWNPLNPNITIGQTKRIGVKEAENKYDNYYKNIKKITTPPKEEEIIKSEKRIEAEKVLKNKTEKIIKTNKTETDKTENDKIIITSKDSLENKNINSTRFFKTERLQKFLDKIKILFIQDGLLPKLIILLLIYILGILHAFESGHGKGILISYLTESDKGKKEALVFSSVMTITHLADVIILAIIFKVLSLSSNIYNYINGLQKIGGYILILMGFYYLIKVFTPKEEYERDSSIKKATVLAFIAGLAPCTVGWAIMVILLSIGKINWVIPVIIVFGLGIWTTLIFFSFIILKIKNKVNSKLKNFSKISSIISAILLLIIGLLLVL